MSMPLLTVGGGMMGDPYFYTKSPEEQKKYLESIGYGKNSKKIDTRSGSGYQPVDPNIDIKPISGMESGYNYDADTATQSPSLPADLAIHNAYSQPLQTEAATGDSYPRIDYGSRDPFSMAANMGQYMTDQAALAVQNYNAPSTPSAGDGPSTDKPSPYGGPASERAHVPKFMRKAQERFGMSKDEILGVLDKAGIQNLDSKKDIKTLRGYFKGLGKSEQPGFDNPAAMQAAGQNKVDRAQAVLDDPGAAREARLKARLQKYRGRDMRRGGEVAQNFQGASERRDKRMEAGRDTQQVEGRMDRAFGKAVARFGADRATEMAGAYGEGRYTNPRREITAEEGFRQMNSLQDMKGAMDSFRAEAGGKKYSQITGKGEKAEARREAALRARDYKKSMAEKLGRIGRKYGAGEVSNIAQAVGFGRFGA